MTSRPKSESSTMKPPKLEDDRERIPFHRPCLRDDDMARALETMRSGWLTTGPSNGEFEDRLAEYLGRRHVVAVSSATAALQLLYRAAGVGPGDEVLMSPLTFVATANVAVHLGATPVFVDVDEQTMNIDPSKIEDRLTDKTKLIVPVHIGGRLCDMVQIRDLGARHGVPVVEDAAHALSTRSGSSRPGEGTVGAAFSFYATKELAMGEGGAVATDDASVAERVRAWSRHGMTSGSWTRARPDRQALYDVESIGYKMNLSDIHAALGLGQIPRLEAMREKREAIAKRYDGWMRDLPGITPVGVAPNQAQSYHLYVIRVRESATLHRDALARLLAERGIQTSVHFVPLHEMSVFRRDYGTRTEDCPHASRLGGEVLSLPIYPDLDFDQVDRIGQEIRGLVEEHTS